MSDPIRDGIQEFLDLYSEDGWSCAHYVVRVGLERIIDGDMQTRSWQYQPPDQAGYITEGLLGAVDDDAYVDQDDL